MGRGTSNQTAGIAILEGKAIKTRKQTRMSPSSITQEAKHALEKLVNQFYHARRHGCCVFWLACSSAQTDSRHPGSEALHAHTHDMMRSTSRVSRLRAHGASRLGLGSTRAEQCSSVLPGVCSRGPRKPTSCILSQLNCADERATTTAAAHADGLGKESSLPL